MHCSRVSLSLAQALRAGGRGAALCPPASCNCRPCHTRHETSLRPHLVQVLRATRGGAAAHVAARPGGWHLHCAVSGGGGSSSCSGHCAPEWTAGRRPGPNGTSFLKRNFGPHEPPVCNCNTPGTLPHQPIQSVDHRAVPRVRGGGWYAPVRVEVQASAAALPTAGLVVCAAQCRAVAAVLHTACMFRLATVPC